MFLSTLRLPKLLPKVSSAKLLKVVLCAAKDSGRNASVSYFDSSESFLQSDTVDEVVSISTLTFFKKYFGFLASFFSAFSP